MQLLPRQDFLLQVPLQLRTHDPPSQLSDPPSLHTCLQLPPAQVFAPPPLLAVPPLAVV